MCSVNVGDEVQFHVSVAIRLQGLGDHDWATTQCQLSAISSWNCAYRSEPPIPMLMMVVNFLPV